MLHAGKSPNRRFQRTGTTADYSLNQIVAQLSEKVEDQEEEMEMADVWSRRKFFNIGFSRLKLTHREIANLSWKSDFSISLTYGKTIYFHKKPIANMIKFGLDYSFMDITYAKLVPNEIPTDRKSVV